jgi:hypothetical protein
MPVPQAAPRPPILADLCRLRSKPVVQGRIIAYPAHWQVPAATEKAAWEAVSQHADSLDFIYVGFPWATVIDGLRRETATLDELMQALAAIRALLAGGAPMRRATVAQHINADQFIDVFAACGVTDMFWSHAQRSHTAIGGVRIHPFPLFPAQTPGGAEHGELHRARRYLANFIGAYNPKAYLTDVREHIFRDTAVDDLLVIKREAWHFERAVYDEQIKGISPDEARLKLEALHKEEYLQAIRDSVFTLCPSGSGPNSIRVGEALALGSIPIILTRTLALPGSLALWETACLFEEDSATGYRRALEQARAMSAAEVRTRQLALRKLFDQVGPHAYSDLIMAGMAGKRLDRSEASTTASGQKAAEPGLQVAAW